MAGARQTAGATRTLCAPMELPEYARVNRAAWNVEAARYVESARRQWAAAEIAWGVWDVPEAEVRALPPVAGVGLLGVGCGTAYVSAWLARRGARPVGVDLSERQLQTAAALQREHDLAFPDRRSRRRPGAPRPGSGSAPTHRGLRGRRRTA